MHEEEFQQFWHGFETGRAGVAWKEIEDTVVAGSISERYLRAGWQRGADDRNTVRAEILW
jgi:hypothetical protein